MKYMKLGSKPDCFQTDGDDVRFVASDLASDIIVNVRGVKFHLHKFPLISKSAHLQKLISNANDGSCDEIDVPDMPGGPSAFEICAKFCYGMTVTLNAYNVVAALCAAEYLEMHELMEKGNLIYKIDVFLNSSVFRSWKDSIIVLQTTKSLLPWSENLKVISRCIEFIACKASVDTSKVDWSYTYNRKKLPSENGLDANWNGVMKQQTVPKDWWVEDLCDLDVRFYNRVIMAIKAKGKMSEKVIGEALKAYTYRRLPDFATQSLVYNGDIMKNQTLVETIVSLLPVEIGSLSCSFLLKLLRAATILNCEEICKKELVKKVGRQLEGASAADLLIPMPEKEVLMYDIDLVMSLVEEFVMQEHGGTRDSPLDEVQEIRSPLFVSDASKIAVAKMIDGYLTEVAKDPNLPISKFVSLSEMVSSSWRPVHDGLYRAIDMYLKEHLELIKTEKKRICSLMDCKKLSLDACAHAVQNERLPLRIIVQILYFEQVRVNTVGVELPTIAQSLLPQENGNSCGSSRSAATTNTEDEWDNAPTVDDIKSLKSMQIVGGSERTSGASDVGKGHNKVKDMLMPKKMFSKLWSHKSHGTENSSSDTSESPGSTNVEELKSTVSRNTRHSVS